MLSMYYLKYHVEFIYVLVVWLKLYEFILEKIYFIFTKIKLTLLLLKDEVLYENFYIKCVVAFIVSRLVV